MHKITLNFTKINLLVLNLIELYNLPYTSIVYRSDIYIILKDDASIYIGKQRANANIVLSSNNSDINLPPHLYTD